MENSKEIIEAQLCAYIDGELSPTEQVEIERHLAANPQHRALIDDLRQMRGLLQGLPRVTAPGELNENLTGSLERSALLDPSEGEESAVVGRINRWPQYAAVAAVLILAIGLAIVVYSVLPPQGNNFVAMNEGNSVRRPVDDLRQNEKAGGLAGDLAKKHVKESEKGAIGDETQRQKDMSNAVVRANGLDINTVENARRRMNVAVPAAQNTAYCMFVSAENTAVANEQVTSYFKSNGILYAVNDAGSLDQLAAGRTVRDQTGLSEKMKIEGEVEQVQDSIARSGGGRGAGGGSGGGGFGGYGVEGGVRGGAQGVRPTNQPEAGKESVANAATAQPEDKSNQPPVAVVGGIGAAGNGDKVAKSLTAASKPAESVPAKAVDDKDANVRHAVPAPTPKPDDAGTESAKKGETLVANTTPQPASRAGEGYREGMTLGTGEWVKSGEQVIVARMSRKQLDELHVKLSNQSGQRAELAQRPMRELGAVALKTEAYKHQQGQQQQDKPIGVEVNAGPQPNELAIAPASLPSNAGMEPKRTVSEPQLEKRADRAATLPTTRPATSALDGGGAKFAEPSAPRAIEALDNPDVESKGRAFSLADPSEELLDVVIVVKPGETAASKVDAAGARLEAKPESKPAEEDAKPADKGAK